MRSRRRYGITFALLSTLLFFLIPYVADIAKADIAPDNTKKDLEQTMFITVIGLIVVAISMLLLHKEKKIVGTLIIAVVILLIVLVLQAEYYASYVPWDERMIDEENSKSQFEFFKPNATLEYIYTRVEESGVDDFGGTFFKDRYIMVYSISNSDSNGSIMGLKEKSSEDGKNWSDLQVLDVLKFGPEVEMGESSLNQILFQIESGQLVCYYTLDFDSNDTEIPRRVTTEDGLNWSNPEPSDSSYLDRWQPNVPTPKQYTDLGWTDLEGSKGFETSSGEYIYGLTFRGHGLDVYSDRGTFFTFSKDGHEWTHLVSLARIKMSAPHCVQESSPDQFVLTCSSWDSGYYEHFYLIRFNKDDFTDVNGPYRNL